MKTDHQCIIELIKVLGRGHIDLIFPIWIRGEFWTGIRLVSKTEWEIYKIEEPDIDVKKDWGVDEMESVLPNDFLNRKEKRYIKEILEDILVNY